MLGGSYLHDFNKRRQKSLEPVSIKTIEDLLVFIWKGDNSNKNDNIKVNSDGSIDIYGSISLSNCLLNKMPFKFNIVTGSFTCNGNKLTDLDGCPNYVGGNFICSENKLTTLKGCPQEVGGMFNCHSNRLKTLEYCPSEVGENFHCEDNLLTELDISSVIGGDLYCSGNMIDPDNCNFYGEVKGKISF